MSRTPNEQQSVSVAESKVTEIKLSDGRTVKCFPAKGKHIRQAQRLMDQDETKMVFAMIVVCATFDGKKITIEELDEMDSKDVFKLMAEYGDSFS